MVFKILLIFVLFSIAYQDIKQRLVYWILFPISAILFAYLYLNHSSWHTFLINFITNTTIVSLMIFILYFYIKLKLKIDFQQAIGLGDILLFFALTCTFPTVTFIVVFVFALIFSLLLHLILKNKSTTIPLAGYMSCFIGAIYLGYWSNIIETIYQF
ncbi:hypothetical protein NO995_07410 [Aestuariibaculum sp. M13]|nr:hypothetical protein [Aestuariibaculum sp. M13]